MEREVERVARERDVHGQGLKTEAQILMRSAMWWVRVCLRRCRKVRVVDGRDDGDEEDDEQSQGPMAFFSEQTSEKMEKKAMKKAAQIPHKTTIGARTRQKWQNVESKFDTSLKKAKFWSEPKGSSA